MMIEIDEATKGIMEDLQSSITYNIEGSISSGLQKTRDDQVNLFNSLQSTLTSKINQIESEFSSSKKPISRISRDVEDTLRIIVKLEKEFNEKLKDVELVQAKHIQQLSEELANVAEESIHNQQEKLNEGMQQITSNTKIAVQSIMHQMDVFNHSFTQILNETKDTFDASIADQLEKFQTMKDGIEHSIATASAQQVVDFGVYLQNIDNLLKQTIEDSKIAQSEDFRKMFAMQKQNSESTTAKLLEENEILTEQLLKTNENIEVLQQEVKYGNLPFYKKWFSRKDATK